MFKEGKLVDVKVPAHDTLATFYAELKSKHEDIEGYLINAVVKPTRDGWMVQRIISKYFNKFNEEPGKRSRKIPINTQMNSTPRRRKLPAKRKEYVL